MKPMVDSLSKTNGFTLTLPCPAGVMHHHQFPCVGKRAGYLYEATVTPY